MRIIWIRRFKLSGICNLYSGCNPKIRSDSKPGAVTFRNVRGSLGNRCKLAIEVLEAVGPGFPIEFRMSGSELFEGGYDLEEGYRIAQMIEPYIDLLHVSAGIYQRGVRDTHPSMFKEHGCNVYLAKTMRL